MLKAKRDCMELETSGTKQDCNERNCENCPYNYEQGNMGEQKQALDMAIEALEQEPILDKIRAEIKALSPEPTAYDVIEGNPVKDAVWETITDVLAIIDKYKRADTPKKRKGAPREDYEPLYDCENWIP